MRFLKAAAMSSLLACMFATSTAAQNLRASIPFSFRIAGQVLPAGEYGLAIDQMHNRIEFRSIDGPEQLYLPVMYSQENGKLAPALVFISYGSTHYLRTVATGSGRPAYELTPSRAERESAKLSRMKTTAEVALSRAR